MSSGVVRVEFTVTEALRERHPTLMVPHVFTFGVVLYTNGNAPTWPSAALREALIAACPPGTGVGEITCTSHGVYLAGAADDVTR